MVLLALLAGLPVAVLATGVVYADASRRGLPRRTRLRWAGGVGVVTVGGFLASFAAESALFRLYAAVRGGRFVAHTPLDVVVGLFVVGLAVGAAAVLTYGVGSRYGPLAAP